MHLCKRSNHSVAFFQAVRTKLYHTSCKQHIYKPVTHSVLKVYNLFVKAQNRSANQLNKLWVRKVLNVPLPIFVSFTDFCGLFNFLSFILSYVFLYILRGNPPDICCILINNFPPKLRLPRRARAVILVVVFVVATMAELKTVSININLTLFLIIIREDIMESP